MQYEYILMVIPIIIIVAFLVVIAKRMTDGERPDISGAVLGTIIIAVGLLVMVPIISSVDPQYAYDDEDKTFTLYKNVTGTEFSWGSAANAESLIIEDTVTTISAGAFASFSNLRYISIPESVTDIGTNAFGSTFKDPYGQTIPVSNIAGSEYAGFGDGELFQCDQSIFALNGTTITGLSTEGASAKYVVIPESVGSIRTSALSETGIEAVLECPRSTALTVGTGAFGRCASLADVSLPSLEEVASSVFQYTAIETASFPNAVRIGDYAFQHCESLTAIDLPIATYIGQSAFQYTALTEVSLSEVETVMNSAFKECTSLASASLPKTTSINNYAFQNCTSMTTVSLPALTTLGNSVFITCMGIASITFGPLESMGSSSPFPNWTFYDSDGTTIIDKTVASNLAGYTFQGTASALVKVLPDRSALTPEQTLKVQELTKTAKALKLEEPELLDA